MPIERILNHSSATDSKRKTLNLLLHYFIRTLPGNMDRPNPAHANEDDKNFGMKKIASFTDEGATVDMMGHIHSNVLFQD